MPRRFVQQERTPTMCIVAAHLCLLRGTLTLSLESTQVTCILSHKPRAELLARLLADQSYHKRLDVAWIDENVALVRHDKGHRTQLELRSGKHNQYANVRPFLVWSGSGTSPCNKSCSSRNYMHSSSWQHHVRLADAGRIGRVSCRVPRSCVAFIMQRVCSSSSVRQNCAQRRLLCHLVHSPALCRVASVTAAATYDGYSGYSTCTDSSSNASVWPNTARVLSR